MTTFWYGPFAVDRNPVCTVFVNDRDVIRLEVPPTERIHLGGFVGDASAVGRDEMAGDGFPAPHLRKYSLIYRVGNGQWCQAGTSTSATVAGSGRLELCVNDDWTYDNNGRWNVSIERTAPDITQPVPCTSSGLIRTHDGNFRVLAVGNLGSLATGSTEGDLLTFWRNNYAAGLPWLASSRLGAFRNAVGVTGLADACHTPSWFQGTDGLLWTVYRSRSQVKVNVHQPDYSARSSPALDDVPGANDCVGAPSFVQSHYGPFGNIELAYPAQDGSIKFRFAWIDSRPCDWRTTPIGWDERVIPFGDPGFRASGVRLMQSTFLNLEALVAGTGRDGRTQLQHWWRHDGGDWAWEKFATLPGSELMVPNSVPAFLQTTLGSGNFEVLAPAMSGGLLRWFLDHSNRDAGWQSAAPVAPGSARVRAVHLLQSDFGPRYNNFEVIAETGEGSPGVGYGRLLFYWGDNATAVSSRDTGWNGPYEIMR